MAHLPHMVDASPCVLPPPLIGWIPCASVCVRGYLQVIWRILPLCWGFRGIPPICWRFGGHQHLWVSGNPLHIHWVSIILYLVAHYVAHIYHGYNYNYSCYGGVFWSVICFISDHGPFLDGASCNIGSV